MDPRQASVVRTSSSVSARQPLSCLWLCCSVLPSGHGYLAGARRAPDRPLLDGPSPAPEKGETEMFLGKRRDELIGGFDKCLCRPCPLPAPALVQDEVHGLLPRVWELLGRVGRGRGPGKGISCEGLARRRRARGGESWPFVSRRQHDVTRGRGGGHRVGSGREDGALAAPRPQRPCSGGSGPGCPS